MGVRNLCICNFSMRKIYLEKYLKNTQRPFKVLEFNHLQEDSTLFLEA